MREFAKAHSEFARWVAQNGRPGWNRLKELHGPAVTPTAPRNTTKKRKAAVKTGEEHAEKKKARQHAFYTHKPYQYNRRHLR
jgi:hypothetical protein